MPPHYGEAKIAHMAEEAITLKTPDGSSGPAVAEIIEYSSSARITKAVLLMVGGVLGGAACIIVPVVHLFTTWGLPLAGILLGLRALRTHRKLDRVTGRCPGCEAEIELVGGALQDSARQKCFKCAAPLELVWPESAAGGHGPERHGQP